MPATIQPPPIQAPMINTEGLCTYPWEGFYRALLERRVTSSRGLIADIPATLTLEDEGYLYYAEDYARQFRWNGATWERAPGEPPHHYAYFDDADPGPGWQLADGSAIYRTNPDGTLGGFIVFDLRGVYLKGAGNSTGPYAAVAPGFTQPTAALTGTGIAATDSGTANLAGASTGVNVQMGAGAFPADVGHTHTDTGHTHGLTDPTHTHTLTGGAVNAAGEPPRFELVPYYRL